MRHFIRSFTAAFFLIGAGSVFAQGQVCDVDVDGDIDLNDINQIVAARNTPAADDHFFVSTAILNPSRTTLQQFQAVSAAGPLTVMLTSSDSMVGLFNTLANGSQNPNTVQIADNALNTANTVATGGIAFDAQSSGGTITVTASAPGFSIPANAGPAATQVTTATDQNTGFRLV